jgi:peptidoglycan/xylan/chitin deacetylase (PgdA/CDA1 family)
LPDPLVLCYHALSTRWTGGLAVAPRRFAHQIRRLLDAGYTGVTFERAMLDRPPGRVFAVTFDDAYASVLAHGVPILRALGVPASVFVPTACAGEAASWPGVREWLAGPDADELRVLGWDDLGALRDEGWEIASHTHRHPRLPELDDAALADELRTARDALRERLGVPCRTVAYPYGATDARVVAAARAAGFAAACGLPGRPHEADRMNWPRVGVYDHDDQLRFALKTSPSVQRLRRRPLALPPAAPPASLPATPLTRGDDARIAVIVPCFDDGRLVADAVASVREREPVQLVVVDDASTDAETLAALDALREGGVTVVRHERNRGVATARATGLAATTAPYVFPLDADDLVVAGALAEMADRLDARPAAAACFGDYAEFGTRHRVRRVPARLDPYLVAYRNDYPIASLYRRSAIEPLGAWQAVGVGYEDWDLWMALAERGDEGVHVGPGTLASYHRLHGPRLNTEAGRAHGELYATLRARHPRLFARLREHRRRSDLPRLERALLPLLYGRRPPLGLRTRAEELLSRRPSS